ncbi:MAG TPA: histidine kinase [Ruania sp.]|nr:histidine kinase [Ruania sp.]
MSPELLAAIASVGAVLAVAAVLWRVLRPRVLLGPSEHRSTYRILHRITLASPPLRAGLGSGAGRAVKHLHALTGSAALALADSERLLAWSGAGESHQHRVPTGGEVSETRVLGPEVVTCGSDDCPLRYAVTAPLTTNELQVGAVTAYVSGSPHAGLVRAVEEIADFISGQLDLAELESSRAELAEADLRALRAQISPHFVYNSLGAIASYIRTDPEHARELVLEFADFTRYSFRRHGEFTTLAEELKSIEHYLTLEQARFAGRLGVTLRIAPEVLGVVVPFLCLQPLVENAVQHGMEGQPGGGQITIVAEDVGNEAHLSIEDDGAGMDPQTLRDQLGGAHGDRVGLANVDERLRTTFGEEYGLVVETAVGAGSKVSLRVPKFHPGVYVA